MIALEDAIFLMKNEEKMHFIPHMHAYVGIFFERVKENAAA